MLEYEFEEVSCGEVYGFYLRETAAHREVILRRAADGWRYMGMHPQKPAPALRLYREHRPGIRAPAA